MSRAEEETTKDPIEKIIFVRNSLYLGVHICHPYKITF
jgi:hypothetical protein